MTWSSSVEPKLVRIEKKGAGEFVSPMSRFSSISPTAPSETVRIFFGFKSDPHPGKGNLGIGAARTDEGRPWILSTVKKAEQLLAQQVVKEEIDHEYLPMLG